MLFNYFMVRQGTFLLYTVEFLLNFVVLFIVLYLYKKYIDKNSLWVYLLTGFGHSMLEFFGQLIGIRVITGAILFNFPIGFPFLPFIIGFFEGGVISLAAYHFVKILSNKNRNSIRIFASLSIFVFSMILFISISAKMFDTSSQNLTLRDMTSPLAITVIIIMLLIPVPYFLLFKGVKPQDRITLLYYYLGLFLFTLVIVIPNHIFGTRYIAVGTEDSYLPASFIEQILVMYVFSMGLEATGTLILWYIFIYHFNLIELNENR